MADLLIPFLVLLLLLVAIYLLRSGSTTRNNAAKMSGEEKEEVEDLENALKTHIQTTLKSWETSSRSSKQAWPLASVLLPTAVTVITIVFWLLGAFDYGEEDARAKALRGMVALIAVSATFTTSFLGLLHSRNVEQRVTSDSFRSFVLAFNSAQETKKERLRLTVETVASIIGLLDEGENQGSPSARADGAMAALVALGKHDLAASLTRVLWSRGNISIESVMLVAHSTLFCSDNNPSTRNSKMEISAALFENANLIEGDHWFEMEEQSWSSEWSYTVKHNILGTVAKLLNKASPKISDMRWFIAHFDEVMRREGIWSEGAGKNKRRRKHFKDAAICMLYRIRSRLLDDELKNEPSLSNYQGTLLDFFKGLPSEPTVDESRISSYISETWGVDKQQKNELRTQLAKIISEGKL